MCNYHYSNRMNKQKWKVLGNLGSKFNKGVSQHDKTYLELAYKALLSLTLHINTSESDHSLPVPSFSPLLLRYP